MFGNTGENDFWLGRRALGKVGPEFECKGLEGDADGHLTEEGESSLHKSAKGKLVLKNGEEFHGEFGRFGGDPLGHSYQYGEKICDYYLGALGLPKPSDPKK